MTAGSAPALAGELSRVAQERFDRFTPTSFPDLFSDAGDFVRLPESFLKLLAEHRAGILSLVGGWLDEIGDGTGDGIQEHPMLEFLSHNTCRYLKNNDQFLDLSPAIRRDLAALYARFLRSFHALLGATDVSRDSRLPDDASEFLAEHRLALRGFVRSLGVRSGALEGNGPHCSEYSAALQRDILHLDTMLLQSPVLDIGCGERAALVRHLRGRGIAAFGIDRFAPPEDYLFRHDWLVFPLGKEVWGTVLSHMAFSHHFLHHHLKGSDQMRIYAARYMEILASLKPGGTFIYSPGLPFIEALLPRDRYQVRTALIPGIHHTEFGPALHAVIGERTAYSVHVRKIR